MCGAGLRFYRTRAGLSQKDLAASATVSRDLVSKIETGERPPAEDFPPRLDVTGVAWRTSSYSGANGGTCVEVGTTGRP